MTGTTAAARVLAQRRKDRRLPTMEGVQVQDPELARAIQNVQEHFRMYEGDSGAPKERFVTIAELENAGIIKSDVKSGFAYISQVLEKDVAQKAGSTANPTLKDPVKRDTSRQSRTPGGAGSPAKAQASTATTQKLNDSQDVSVAKPTKNEFLYYDGNKFTNFPLFRRDNTWQGQQIFVQPLTLLERASGPSALDDRGYLWLREGNPNTLWFTDSSGTEMQLSSAGGTLPAGTTTNAALKWNGSSWVEDTDLLLAGTYARFNEEVHTLQAVSASSNVSDVGQVGQFAFLDVNGGVGRFGSYNWDTGAWQPSAFIGSTVSIRVSADGQIDMLSDNNITVSGFTGHFNLQDGMALRVYDSTDTDSLQIYQTASGAIFQTTQHIYLRPGTNHFAYVYSPGSAGQFRVYDPSGANYVSWRHNGASALETYVGTTHKTISGLTGRIQTSGIKIEFGRNTSGGIYVDDTRSTDDAPADYKRIVRFDFKQRSTLGFQGNDSFGGVMSFAPWSDASGGPNYQLVFSNNSNVPLLAIRAGDHGALAADWGTWYQIHSTADFPTPPGGTTDFLRADGTWAAPATGLPTFNFNVSDTLEARHSGHSTGKTNTTAYTLTGPTSSDVDFPVGGVCTVMNLGSSTNYTISDTATCTMYHVTGSAVTDITGSGTLAPGGIVTLYRYSTSAIYIWGSGFTA